VANLDDARAQLLAGQAERLRNDAARACELLGRGSTAELVELLERNRVYANAIWHELDLLTRPPGVPQVRGKSRHR
jgi:hypothetical protein